MEYLTAKEAALNWNVSSRMVAYYCKSGHIDGAIKKGKTWLIPVHVEKPKDNRFSCNKVVVSDNPQLLGELTNINDMDSENIPSVYHTGDLLKNLGITRETLRYYEDIGLIVPKRNPDSQYREFTFDDASRLMAIDFYKKRGFTPLDIKELIMSDGYNPLEILKSKIDEMENSIRTLRRIVKRLSDAERFCEYAVCNDSVFTVRDLPLYVVMETFDSVSFLSEYQNRVLASLDLQEEDILSNLVRAVSFDSSGYKGTKMCLVRQYVNSEQTSSNLFLESGRCLHTVMEADSHDDSLMEKMFLAAHRWATEHVECFKGVVYIFIRYVTLTGLTERNLYEVWIPLK